MLIAHVSDQHLRDRNDAIWLERQLDRIAARRPDHVAITGDLLDRWHPALLSRALDALERHDLLHADRLTILHGNHDLASSGGHPRRSADLWRMATRFWDPPPALALRRRRFAALIARRADGIAGEAPWSKRLPGGATIAVVDSVPAFWAPIHLAGRVVVVSHAIGSFTSSQAQWLSGRDGSVITLMHHYPLDAPTFRWTADRLGPRAASALRAIEAVEVPMAIREPDRARFWDAAVAGGTRLVLCGHVHRARLERHRGIYVGLNGQSGAEWAGRAIAWYEVGETAVTMELEKLRTKN